jgi:hypothetical protein
MNYWEYNKTKVKKLKICYKRGLYEHPNKWKRDNPIYYSQYLFWIQQLPLETRSHLNFFDEVRIDRTDSNLCMR